ncbi:glutathione S-transferase [Pandoraea anhela]|uniref:Glutathione S-transferase n=2 Tax=Pandoraea anhela TaxID=2508295 RepID=A0A5E4WE81_9BURK|nr:glutathione S-transferase [Pandoraea anhela]
MYRLHDSKLSGNAWKVRLLLSRLGIPFERITYVLPEGKTRQPSFLRMHALGKVPVLETPSGEHLFESNAILCLLAQGTDMLPDGFAHAQVMQWLFFEQSEVLKPFASARYWISIARRAHEKIDEISAWHLAGKRVLSILNTHLATRRFMVAERYSIADIALFVYVSMAPEGGYDLTPFPNVTDWITRIRSQAGFVPLTHEEAVA